MVKSKRIRTPQQLWESISSRFVNFVERIFFTLGVVVARHPWKTVTISWSFVLVSCFGLLNFHIEKNPIKLWVPPESDFYRDTNWYIDKFGTGFRLQRILITADDVLTPDVLHTINNVTNEINSIEVKYKYKSYSIKDLCYEVPVINFFTSNRKTRSIDLDVASNKSLLKTTNEDFSDLTLWVNDKFYCSFIENFPLVCLQYNLLDLWNNDPELINNTTKREILMKINQVKTNPTTGHPTDYTKLLGGIEHDDRGDIVSAKSVLLSWYTQVNMSAVDLDEVGNLVGTEEWVSVPLALWEIKYLDFMKSFSYNVKDIKVYYESGRSFGDISGETMFQEIDKLFLGIALMFIYIQFGLSRCNWLEIRLTLGGVGLMCVGMAYITAISWCSTFGVSFGPVHSSLPFLLMGLGVDDMFVMKACWENLSNIELEKSLPLKIGLMLKHAGVSIVITSFTDIVALLIGAITILPSLKSFCIYAAAGVFFIFCYSITFYVAVFTLDLKRIESNRNGILFCYKHKKKINITTERTILQKGLSSFYKNIVFTIPIKAGVIIFTIIITAVSVEAIFRLEQRFDPQWFIPEGTYYKEYLNNYEYYYPEEGHTAMIFLGEMNYNHEFAQLYNTLQELRKKSYVNDLVTWIESFHGYVLKNYHRDLKNASTVSDAEFKTFLSRFLFSPIGGRFQINFKFSQPFHCGDIATNITASTMMFKFTRFQGPEEYIPAMNYVKHIVKSTNITTGDGYRSVWSKAFGNWVTDEIIAVEVERNIELALLCVMICTVILITNLQMCFWIFLCVLLTIVNVLGFMQRWGMTVDIVCCIGLELAIGLCVDYAAHVGHTFLTISEGSRSDRAFKTVTSIGTAVMLGGGSTLLSLSLLSMSKAYTFQSFFKIFLLVILFGLFNGLIFLPVVLALIGPSAYKANEGKEESMEAVELNNKIQVTEKEIDDP